MQVLKFGGDALSDAARFRNVARVVAETHGGDTAIVVVCSAIDGITDLLLGAARSAVHNDEARIESTRRELWSRHRSLAEKLVPDEWEREELFREWGDLLKIYDRVTRAIATLGEPSPRGIDAVAALGERLIAHLVASVLRQNGVAARTVDATQLIVTDQRFGAANPLPTESTKRIQQKLRAMVKSGVVPVVTGYIGATPEGVVTTLGRGGGDYTAALIGAALQADEVWIWTDVDGILTADPKIVASARTLNQLSYTEAAEIATLNPVVLNPRTITTAMAAGIPLRIANLFRPEHPGTRIVADATPTTSLARSIISTRTLQMVVVNGSEADGWSPVVAVRALAELFQAGVETLTFAESFGEQSLTMIVRSADAEFACERLNTIFAAEQAAGVLKATTLGGSVALVTVVNASGDPELTPRTLATLGKANAQVLALVQSAASGHVTFTLPDNEANAIVRALHTELIGK
jgi:aspartate kinase